MIQWRLQQDEKYSIARLTKFFQAVGLQDLRWQGCPISVSS
jgi:hypothetical protein